jgi:hypothetical protein
MAPKGATANLLLSLSNAASLQPYWRASRISLRERTTVRVLLILSSLSSASYHAVQFRGYRGEWVLLVIDRIAAVALAIYSLCLYPSYARIWGELRANSMLSAAAAIAGIASELPPKTLSCWYILLHSAWHVLIYTLLAQCIPM